MAATGWYFANLYLDVLDHFVKEQLREKRDVRYMDDFVCFFDDKDVLHDILGEVRRF